MSPPSRCAGSTTASAGRRSTRSGSTSWLKPAWAGGIAIFVPAAAHPPGVPARSSGAASSQPVEAGLTRDARRAAPSIDAASPCSRARPSARRSSARRRNARDQRGATPPARRRRAQAGRYELGRPCLRSSCASAARLFGAQPWLHHGRRQSPLIGKRTVRYFPSTASERTDRIRPMLAVERRAKSGSPMSDVEGEAALPIKDWKDCKPPFSGIARPRPRAGPNPGRKRRRRAVFTPCATYTASRKASRRSANSRRAMHDRTGNLPPLPGIFPDYPAPIVRNHPDGRELTMAQDGACRRRHSRCRARNPIRA